MTNALILGAGGKVAGHVIEAISKNDVLHLTLYLRNAGKLKQGESDHVSIVQGDILDTDKLNEAIQGKDIVYVNINGNEDVLAQHVVNAMKTSGVKRLIFIAALGIYNEVPGAFGKWNQQMLGAILERYKKAADLIESSGLQYTILRPTWYTDKDEVNYILTQKGEPVTGTEISRKSVADIVIKIIENPALHTNESIGMEKEGTEGDKPSWH